MKFILCMIFGHKYYAHAKPAETWSAGVRWLKCRRCGRNFLIDSKSEILLPMDFELMDMHKWQKVIIEDT